MPMITVAGITEPLSPGETGLYQKVIERVEMELIGVVLDLHEGNQTKTAMTLGISRFTLRKKIRLLEIRDRCKRDGDSPVRI